jgi:hypothetical protein
MAISIPACATEDEFKVVTPAKRRSFASWALLGLVLEMSLVGKASGATAIFLVPVYEWTLVWSETRNPNYMYGSIWR